MNNLKVDKLLLVTIKKLFVTRGLWCLKACKLAFLRVLAGIMKPYVAIISMEPKATPSRIEATTC